MSIQIHGTLTGVGEHATTEGSREAGASFAIEVNVIFTDSESTLAALKMAGSLACNLGARINLVAAQVVPLVFPLTRPPIAVDYTEQRLLDLAHRGAQGPIETSVQLYLCRDKRQALLRVLKPKSLVVIGAKRRWCHQGEQVGGGPAVQRPGGCFREFEMTERQGRASRSSGTSRPRTKDAMVRQHLRSAKRLGKILVDKNSNLSY